MENQRAVQYLNSLLGKTLRVHTSDSRLFVGTFKCTDNERNIILEATHEYRHPSAEALSEAATQHATSQEGNVKLNMTSRFIGLVVVPGQYITKIELEEVPSR
ncbi:hypothetical protein VTO42DRAFT_5728 [Malbranchea cinnamomea]